MILHPFHPVFDCRSEILILGSFPSVKSRADNFFYAHPQNRFWVVLSSIFEQPLPQTVAEKKRFLLENHIALWDVIAACEITGSSDSSIKNAIANDLSPILQASSIRAVYTNGKTADDLYETYLADKTGIRAVRLPSTSPANASWSVQKLIQAWSVIRN